MEDIEPEKIQSEAMAEGETAVNEEVNASKEHIDSVKVVTQLDDIYIDTNGSLKNVHEKRYLNWSSRFEQLYEEKPQFFVRAPGRANIIGEHIDYCGYSVLPFALEQDFIIAYSKSTRKEIRINNIDMALFPEEILETEPRQKMRETAWWINYFLAGYKSVMWSPEIEEEIKNGFEPTGLKVFIDSNVPMEAGVSSSSAFTVCTAILSLHANGFLDKFDRTKLANYIINGERLVGTASGGMDQTISLMAEKGEAKFIDFHPKISAQSTSIPSKYVFVVSNSLTPSPKAIQFATRYNKRVVECRIATIILAKAHDKSGTILDPESWPYKTLYELQWANNWDNDTLLELISSTLKPGGYSKSDVEEALNSKSVEISLNDIQKMYEVWQNNVRFFIYERAYHVISEYKRVLQFRSICMNDYFNIILTHSYYHMLLYI